ncbi:hypothetical protein BN890_41130 [Bacteroides xylanisolvens SD CC 1b]|uniref:Uncharacterized protein n=2 Tax=Bacteroides TaxID=816 RepID=W6PR96_9BACE|nr:hypothetical protein BACOVA_03881 [Bacteroides ovatus ATCC 8483]EEZ03683.1 hypothetical protein HMPREF0102_02745 [Bacteroides sp. 2_1_22]CDL98268.1 hypothetical protein BN891_11590 [Bacteroides xylanisolvens SD CC 2a]CDM03926.1 hypothetical protein BN890_14930 [Bacteroides xylanisolvens SD CC 1b]CDM06510.1 hypothetical protein BN890_41130 [Bacteroides xylanisolvens SD CC 1b]
MDYSFSYFSACTISYRQFLLPENGVKMAKFLFAKLVNNDYLY